MLWQISSWLFAQDPRRDHSEFYRTLTKTTLAHSPTAAVLHLDGDLYATQRDHDHRIPVEDLAEHLLLLLAQRLTLRLEKDDSIAQYIPIYAS